MPIQMFPLCRCGRHRKVGSLNCDHIVEPVQTVTHTVKREELTLEKRGAENIYLDNAGHKRSRV